MPQTGFTPLQLYSTSTAAAVPSAGNLINSTLGSELAINITDGKLFYKDNLGAVQVIGWKTVPTTAGGTGLTSYSQGDLLYYNTGTTLTALAKNTTATRYLSNTGSSNNPAWAQIDLTNGVTGTLPTGNGGTGLASFTANGLFYASSTSVIAQSASLTFSGTTLTAGNYSTGGNLTFTGTGNRITGDFSNATLSNRVAFQSSTTNGNTALVAIPNGTATSTVFDLFNNSNTTNAAFLRLFAFSTGVGLNSDITGTGTSQPILFSIGTERVRISTTGQLIVGSSSTPASGKFAVYDGRTFFSANGETYSLGFAFNTTRINSGQLCYIGATDSATPAIVFSNAAGTERFRIEDNGDLTSLRTYSATVGGTNRDVFVDNTGLLGYVTSIRASKTNISNISDTDWLYKLKPVSFNYRKKDIDGNYTEEIDGPIEYGLIAEDTESVKPELCFYDEIDGKKVLRGISYSKLVTPMLQAIQELRREFEEYKNSHP